MTNKKEKTMKMKPLNINITNLLVCALLSFAGSVQADAPEDAPERVSMGTRPFSLTEHVALQEARALEEEQGLDAKSCPCKKKQKDNEDSSEGEEHHCTCHEVEKEDVKTSKDVLSRCRCEDEDEDELQAKMFPFTTSHLTTTHQGIYQSPKVVSPLGDTVELIDGSIWNVCSNHRYKTFDWLTTDQIIIKPNHNWFSVYHYTLTNLNTKANVSVNLSVPPHYNGVHTHWIAAIDHVNRQVCLEDGTVWTMRKSDRSALNKWAVNDTLIMGVNNGYFSSKAHPNILINVNVLNHSRGAVMY